MSLWDKAYFFSLQSEKGYITLSMVAKTISLFVFIIFSPIF